MKYLAFAAIILLVSACGSNSGSSARTNNEEILFPFGQTDLKWAGIEKSDKELKAKFKDKANDLLKDEYGIYDSGEKTQKDFEGNCHVVDVNNDGLNDIIYTGSTGGEGSEVAIFLNTKDGFKQIFKKVQYIVKLEFKDNKLFRLYILDDGCCDARVDFNKVYEVNYNDGSPSFNVIYLTSNLHIARFPKSYLKKPVYFEVLNNNYKLHLEPSVEDSIVNDFTYEGHSFKAGNTIDTLSKGTKGRAIATKTDKTGRVWWLVEIDPSYNEFGDLFYESPDDKGNRAGKIGWMSSRYVKKIGHQNFIYK